MGKLQSDMRNLQSDMAYKMDNMQQTLSKLTNALTIQERGRFQSQPQQIPRGLHEIQAQEKSSSYMREVQAVMTLRSGKQVEKPTPPPPKLGEEGEHSTTSKKVTASRKTCQVQPLILDSY